MEVTIDKFGRVLIPKRLREKMGLFPGTRLSVEANVANSSLQLTVGEPREPRLAWQDGLPIIITDEILPESFDVKTFIQEGYIEYLDGKAGLS